MSSKSVDNFGVEAAPNVGISRRQADPERSEGEAKPVGCMPCWAADDFQDPGAS
jgi:hypothetical protein